MSRDERRSTDWPEGRRKPESPDDPDTSRLSEGADGNTRDPYSGPLRRRDDPPGEAAFDGPGGGAYYEGDQVNGHEEAAWGESAQRRERRRRPGRDAAQGPGDYHRSDDSLREEIREQLTHRPDLDASEIEVLVEGGEVTLQGKVEDQSARWLVEDLVEAVSGVSLVYNRLRVVG